MIQRRVDFARDPDRWYKLSVLHYRMRQSSFGLPILLVFVLTLLIGFTLLSTATQATVIPMQILTAVDVDTTDDPKATGYPDSRKLVRDSQGALYLAYRKSYKLYSISRDHIFVAKSTDEGKTWKLVNRGHPIELVGDHTQRVPSIAVDSQDALHVVWYGADAKSKGDDDRQIKYVRSDDGGESWTAWRSIARVTGYHKEELWQEHPIIYIGAQDALYVVWEGKDADHPKQQVKLVRSVDRGATWSDWTNIHRIPEATFSRPTLLGDENVLYALAYAQLAPQPESQIVWSQSTDGGENWSRWDFVAPGSKDQRHVSAVLDRQSQLHIAWRQQPESSLLGPKSDKTQIYYAYYANQGWNHPELVAINEKRNQFSPSMTLDVDNQVWVAWVETTSDSGYPKENPTGMPIIAGRRDGHWQKPVQLCNANRVSYPNLRWQRLGAAGNLDVVWVRKTNDEERSLVYCSVAPIE